MEPKALQDLFIKILGSELNECELDGAVKEQLTPEVVPALYALSKRHDLAHIVSSALYQSGALTDEALLAKFNRDELLSVYRNEQMKYAYGQICEILDCAAIPYIPLKGSVIRPYYPRESMRTSCDIDILVKEEDLERAVDALKAADFTCGERGFHDVSLYSPNKIHLELHFSLQESIEHLDAVLREAWQYALPAEGSRFEFSKEFFLFHMFAHISYHFLSGGCGIRPLMDIWIMEHKMGADYSQARELLERAGIYKFAGELSNLVDACFSDQPRDDFSDILLNYIFTGGVYGTTENHIAINDAKTHVTPKYIAKRIFIPYRGLVVEYPVLKKAAILYPFCWLHRSFRLACRLVRNTFKRKKIAKGVSDAQTDHSLQMRQRLGL